MDVEKQEVINHAIVGGLIAVALVTFHELAELVSKLAGVQGSLKSHIWTAAFLLIVLFAAAFTLIALTASYLQRRTKRERIKLAELGFVDGTYVDAVIENGQVRSGGVVDVRSAAGEGFHIEGTTYNWNQGTFDEAKPGYWRTLHGRLFERNGVAYVYSGTAPNSSEHFGVGYYAFLKHADNELLLFEGGFFSKQENIASHVIGRQITAQSHSDALAILCKFLQSSEVIEFARKHSGA